LAEEYLRRRHLELPGDDEALRYYSPCPFGTGTYPCLLALFRDIVTNEPRAIHRIALGPGGILIAKRMLGRVGGCAVKLDADENVELSLSIGEGVETVLAARMRGFRPAWALGSAGTLKNFPVLNGVECLSIIVDNDEPDKNGRRAGQGAALECSTRWTAAGREVRRIVPRRLGADMADLAEAPQ
jgi:putative DNA primase/helicase